MYFDYYSLLMFGVAAVFLTVVVWSTVQGLNELKYQLYTRKEVERFRDKYIHSQEDTGEVQAQPKQYGGMSQEEFDRIRSGKEVESAPTTQQ